MALEKPDVNPDIKGSLVIPENISSTRLVRAYDVPVSRRKYALLAGRKPNVGGEEVFDTARKLHRIVRGIGPKAFLEATAITEEEYYAGGGYPGCESGGPEIDRKFKEDHVAGQIMDCLNRRKWDFSADDAKFGSFVLILQAEELGRGFERVTSVKLIIGQDPENDRRVVEKDFELKNRPRIEQETPDGRTHWVSLFVRGVSCKLEQRLSAQLANSDGYRANPPPSGEDPSRYPDLRKNFTLIFEPQNDGRLMISGEVAPFSNTCPLGV